MSKEIDWSKAPEGAIGHGNIGAGHFRVWFSDRWYEYVDSNHGGRHYFGDTCTYKKNDIVSVTYRPSTPSWSGEGLPPVGVVCGKCYNSPSEYYSVKVLAHDSHYGEVVIYRWVDGPLEGELDQSTMHLNMASGSNAHWSFRPIRTPEQIAADERCKEIDEMVKALGMDDPGTAEYIRCGLIYDAGFRKP